VPPSTSRPLRRSRQITGSAFDAPASFSVRALRYSGHPDDAAVPYLGRSKSTASRRDQSGHQDVIDGHAALCVRGHHHAVVTSDVGDLARIDPELPLIHA
jgi:hypothetical protein